MANDITTPFDMAQQDRQIQSDIAAIPPPAIDAPPPAIATDEELLELFKDFKKLCFDGRDVFERQWQRNILYVLNRQWIEYFSKEGVWRDKRLASWIPRPVTNICKNVVRTIRSMFTSIKLGVNVRPNGADPQNVSAAATADELAPVLYETHDMNRTLSEFDFWLCVTGNAFMHTFVDYDVKNGFTTIDQEVCATCGKMLSSADLQGPSPVCPDCGGTQFTPGEPLRQPKAKPMTSALSPLEMAAPSGYSRWSDVPGCIRLRWRSRHYCENHPTLKTQVNDMRFSKSPSDNTMQLFKSLANHNDLGISTSYYSGDGVIQDEGLPEYEVNLRPCDKYPDGLVFRVLGDGEGARIVHNEAIEAIPGPLPYKDADGNPLFTFTHAGYEPVGGRLWASGPLDAIIEKQDGINRIDSMTELHLSRTSNPVWLKPKGAGVTQMTGMPGLIIEWDALVMNGAGKPERIPGETVNPSFMQLREQYMRDAEELTGTFDIMKGQKPSGIEAFSAMQLLVERSQATFALVFQSRGDAFKDWFKFAIELEREFGPDEITKAVLSPARTWTFQNFKRAQLQGSFAVIVEDGSAQPKTNLGQRAALDHANMLGMVNMQDPDQQYEGLKLMGLQKMVPSLDTHVQKALQKQQAFEEWIGNPQAMQQAMVVMQQNEQKWVAANQGKMPTMAAPQPSPLDATPLKWRKWYSAPIHLQEFTKWANGDRVQEILAKNPQAEDLLTAHYEEMQANMPMPPLPAPKPGGGGGGAVGMSNSNAESTKGLNNSGTAGSQPV